MNDIEQFIREAATARGIDPDVAIKVALSEGGITEYARHGDFETGDSWWPFQLHYGGDEYPQFGTVAGMGNGFTALTGWQPGDPKAWRDSTRYALNRAKLNGWGAWYGAAHVGVGRWDGIDRNHPWDASSERWDYETGANPMPAVTYNRAEPAIAQNDSWSCAPTSTRWGLKALGRMPTEEWIESQMLADGIVTREQGLMDASGAQLAAWLEAQYGEFGYLANNEPVVTWDWAVHEGAQPDGSGHAYPVLLGGRAWGHWTALRDFDPGRGLLLLANPADGWMNVGQTMDMEQFAALGPFSAVRLWHPDLLAAAPEPPPLPPLPPRWTVEQLRDSIREILMRSDADHAARSIRSDLADLYDRSG